MARRKRKTSKRAASVKNRVKELRMVKASELRGHPDNWRLHPKRQQAAMKGVLKEVGFASAIVARELDDGSLQIIDGHLRAEVTGNSKVPVLIVDLDDDEARKVLATFDPLSSAAEVDEEKIAELLASINIDDEALSALVASITSEDEESGGSGSGKKPEPSPDAMFQVIASCRNEQHQQEVYELLRGHDIDCKVSTLW